MLGTTLDVAIGLIFIFMLFSLFLSAALEAVASLFRLRARGLEIAIAQMMADTDAIPAGANLPAKGLFGLLGGLHRAGAAMRNGLRGGGASTSASTPTVPTPAVPTPTVPTPTVSFQEVYGHPLIGAVPGHRPSYIPATNFTSALLYVVGGNGGTGSLQSDIERGVAALPAGSLRTALTTAVNEAEGDMDTLRLGVERWYDNAMDRLSGQYKRFSQTAMFILALLLALAYRIDAIQIGERLYADSAMRSAFVAAATTYAETHQQPGNAAGAPSGAQARPIASQPAPGGSGIHQAGPEAPAGNAQAPAPTGGQAGAANGAVPRAGASPQGQAPEALPNTQQTVERLSHRGTELSNAMSLLESTPPPQPSNDGVWARIVDLWRGLTIGMLVTALAGMLGAPFWFDLLQKAVQLRGTGPQPVQSTTTDG
jgi:hypothetical protein